MTLRSFTNMMFMLLLLTTIGITAAQSEVTPTPALDSALMLPPTKPYILWEGTFRLRAGVPFAWLRQDPFSTGAVVATVPAGGSIQAVAGQNAEQVHDGTQWWGYVSGRQTRGWVELNSIEQVTDAAPSPTPMTSVAERWSRNTVVRVKSSVPFAWIRGDLSESAPTILGTYLPGARLVIVAGPHLGNSQVMWQVRDPNSNIVGFIEQSSLEFVRSRPNFTVAPIPPSAWLVGFSLRLKSSVPFVWIRSAPDSQASIIFTVQRGGVVSLSSTEVRNDGIQNWRQVMIAQSPVNGWVEENALEFDRIWTRF
jgi:hypothetical protein